MIDWKTLKEQTMGARRAIAGLLSDETHRAHLQAPTWKNNLHWHAGHLVTTPHLLTYGVMGEPIVIPEDYRRWFAKGTSPATWGNDPVPSFESLVEQVVVVVPGVFDAFEERADVPLPQPYATSLGVILRTPAEALNFSLVHDGIHIGMIQAFKRGLNAMT